MEGSKIVGTEIPLIRAWEFGGKEMHCLEDRFVVKHWKRICNRRAEY